MKCLELWGKGVVFASISAISTAFILSTQPSIKIRSSPCKDTWSKKLGYVHMSSLQRNAYSKASDRFDQIPGRRRRSYNETSVSILDYEKPELNTFQTNTVERIDHEISENRPYQLDDNDVEIIKHFERSMELQIGEMRELMDASDEQDSCDSGEEYGDHCDSVVGDRSGILVSGDSAISVESSNAEFIESNNEEEVKTGNIPSIWQARLLLLGAAALYGTNFTFVKVLNEQIPVEISTMLRFGLALISMIPLLFMTKSEATEPSKLLNQDEAARNVSNDIAILLAGMETGIWNSMGYICQAVGLETTQAGTSAFVCSLAVVVVPVLDYLHGKSISWKQVAGLVIAVVGVGLLEVDFACDFSNQSICDSFSIGNLLTLVQPFAFGLGFWRMEKSLKLFPNDALKLTVGQIGAVFIGSILYLGVSRQAVGIDGPLLAQQIYDWITTPEILGALFWTGAITTAATVYMETLAMKTLSAAETTMIFSTEPIFGSVFAAVTIGEVFGVGGIVGASAILAGVLISNMDT